MCTAPVYRVVCPECRRVVPVGQVIWYGEPPMFGECPECVAICHADHWEKAEVAE